MPQFFLGILSFDIIAYRIDITPFVGLLNDRQAHLFSFSVYNNSLNGFWYIDPVLVVYRSSNPLDSFQGNVECNDMGTSVNIKTNWNPSMNNTNATFIFSGILSIHAFISFLVF